MISTACGVGVQSSMSRAVANAQKTIGTCRSRLEADMLGGLIEVGYSIAIVAEGVQVTCRISSSMHCNKKSGEGEGRYYTCGRILAICKLATTPIERKQAHRNRHTTMHQGRASISHVLASLLEAALLWAGLLGMILIQAIYLMALQPEQFAPCRHIEITQNAYQPAYKALAGEMEVALTVMPKTVATHVRVGQTNASIPHWDWCSTWRDTRSRVCRQYIPGTNYNDEPYRLKEMRRWWLCHYRHVPQSKRCSYWEGTPHPNWHKEKEAAPLKTKPTTWWAQMTCRCTFWKPTAPATAESPSHTPEAASPSNERPTQHGAGPTAGDQSHARRYGQTNRKTWVTPQSVGLHCTAQVQGYCALHALEAMAGRPIIGRQAAKRLLQHPAVPPPTADSAAEYNGSGWFTIEAVNKIIYYLTTVDVAIVAIATTEGAPQQWSKEEVLARAPAGCNAFYVHKPGHFVCWRRSEVDPQHNWYELDSISFARNGGKIRRVADAEWSTTHGTWNTTVQVDAYLSKQTNMELFSHRGVPLPSDVSTLQYVDLRQVHFAEQGPITRPAAEWIAADTAAKNAGRPAQRTTHRTKGKANPQNGRAKEPSLPEAAPMPMQTNPLFEERERPAESKHNGEDNTLHTNPLYAEQREEQINEKEGDCSMPDAPMDATFKPPQPTSAWWVNCWNKQRTNQKEVPTLEPAGKAGHLGKKQRARIIKAHASAHHCQWKKACVQKKPLKEQYNKLKQCLVTEAFKAKQQQQTEEAARKRSNTQNRVASDAHTASQTDVTTTTHQLPTQTDHTGQIKFLTLNGRGIKGKVSLMREVVKEDADIIAWTETQLKGAANLPKWATIALRSYEHVRTGLHTIQGQAGVLLAVKRSFLMGATMHRPAVPPEYKGYIARVQFQREGSAPMDLFGVYMPTCVAARIIRKGLHAHLKAEILACKAKGHIPVLLADANAALYEGDREHGRKGDHDCSYRQFVAETGLRPMAKEDHASRQRTFRREHNGNQYISRIDDILTTLPESSTSQAEISLLNTEGMHTDHNGVRITVPFIQLQQLPVPSAVDRSTTHRLKPPSTEEERQMLARVVSMSVDSSAQKLWQELNDIVNSQVKAHWATQEERQGGPTPLQQVRIGMCDPSTSHLPAQAPLPASTAVNILGSRLSEILQNAHKAALQLCPTIKAGPSAPEHYLKRSIARRRKKLLEARRRLRNIRFDQGTLGQASDLVDSTLKVMLEAARSENQAALHLEDLARQSAGKEVEALLKKQQQELDKEDGAFIVQKHIRMKRKQAEKNQKRGNKEMTGQYKESTRHAQLMWKVGDTLITKPEAVKQHTQDYVSAKLQPADSSSNSTDSASSIHTYPWERAKAQDKFTLQTQAQGEPQLHGLQSSISDKAGFTKCIRSLSNGKMPGPDEIPNEIIKASPPIMQECMHMLMMLMWATGHTPDTWKTSYTILLYKNKGSMLDLDYYRRIGLENTLYKLWTKFTQDVLSNYANRHNILSQEQGGFRAHKSTIQQLEVHTSLLEDARLMQQDLYVTMVDLKEAFDTIDHQVMLKIMTDLGFPADAVRVVKGLYEDTYTTIKTPYGDTQPLRVGRGTLQGDSLSPFLFILYLEPLLRWLSVGGKGYQPGSLRKEGSSVTFSNTTYADDLTLYTGAHTDMADQADKVSQYAAWGGLTVSQSKTLITAALYKRNPARPLEATLLDRLTSQIKMQGQRITVHNPQTPYKLLGVWFTMDLNWSHQHTETCSQLKEMGRRLGESYGSQAQKLLVMQTCLKAKAQYAFPLMCYNDRQIQSLDSVMDAVVRAAYRLPPGTPTAMIREDIKKGGLGNASLMVAYTATAVKNLTRALNDAGKRGDLTRALLKAQLQAYKSPELKRKGAYSWVPDYALRLRQLVLGTRAGTYMWIHEGIPYSLPENHVAQTVLGNVPAWAQSSKLTGLAKPLRHLQAIGVFYLHQLLTVKADRFLTAPDLARQLGHKTALPQRYTRALKQVIAKLGTPCSNNQQGGKPLETALPDSLLSYEHRKVHPSLQTWVNRYTTAEKAGKVPPADVLQMLREASLLPPGQRPATINCGGKRKRTLVLPTEQREPPEMENSGDSMLDTSVTRRIQCKRLLTKKRKPQTVYNVLCAHHESTPQPTGKIRHRNTYKPHTREALTKQIQWQVTWSQCNMQKWELDLAQERLGYKIKSTRPAVAGDFEEADIFCEYCIQGAQAAQVYECSQCQRGYHEHCLQRKAGSAASNVSTSDDEWMCPECTQHQQMSGAGEHAYLVEVAYWHTEWQSSWEDSATMIDNGHEGVVQQTLQALQDGAATPQPTAKPRRDAHIRNMARQGNSGPKQHTTLGEDIRKKVSFESHPVDPHADIVGTGRCEVTIRTIDRRHKLPGGRKQNYCNEMACVHDAAGHTVGTLSVQRMARLKAAFKNTKQDRPELQTSLQPGTFEEEVAALLGRYKEGNIVPGTGRTITPLNQRAIPKAVYSKMQQAIPLLNKERYASPLNHHEGIDIYWSCFERDQLFGAHYNAYSCQWQGYSCAHPEHDTKEAYKAVSWGVHSAKLASRPTLTVYFIPAAWSDGTSPAYLKWLAKEPEVCKHIMTIPRKSFKLVPMQMEVLGMSPEDADTPQWDMNILMVGNAAGYATVHPHIDEWLTELRKDMVRVVNEAVKPAVPLSGRRLELAKQRCRLWQPDPAGEATKQANDAATQQGASGSPARDDPILYRPPDKVKNAATEPCQRHPSQCFTTHMAHEIKAEYERSTQATTLKYDWREFVYTDGSVTKVRSDEGRPGIGAGLYIPNQNSGIETGRQIGIEARDVSGPDNTAYRAELVAIMAALAEGHGHIMTDCLNAVHAVRNAVMDPEALKFHRHGQLLSEIVRLASLRPTGMKLIKIKGHSGIPGNEYADDIAGLVATGTEPPEIILDNAQSNNRDQQYWPKKREWREDNRSETGYQEHWWTLPNLEDSLTKAVHEPMHMGQADQQTAYYRYMQEALPLIAPEYAGTWETMKGVTPRMRAIRAKYLTGQLPTAKNLFRYGKTKSATCPLCRACLDSGHHAVAGCKSMQKVIQEKHNGLVRIIAKAIAAGEMGTEAIAYTDGGSWEKWNDLGAAAQHRTFQDVPAELISQQQAEACHSRPDMLLYKPESRPTSQDGNDKPGSAQVIIVEVKYTRDTDIAQQLEKAQVQHKAMGDAIAENLPSANIKTVVVLMGIAGTVYQEHTKGALHALGVRGSHRDSTLRKMQQYTLAQLLETWQKRQAAIRQARRGPNTENSDPKAPHSACEGEGIALASHGVLGGGRGESLRHGRGGRPASSSGPSSAAPDPTAAATGGTHNHQSISKRRHSVRGKRRGSTAAPAGRAGAPAAVAGEAAEQKVGSRRRRTGDPLGHTAKRCKTARRSADISRSTTGTRGARSDHPARDASTQHKKRSGNQYHHALGDANGGQENRCTSRKRLRPITSCNGCSGAHSTQCGGGAVHLLDVQFCMGWKGGKTGVG